MYQALIMLIAGVLVLSLLIKLVFRKLGWGWNIFISFLIVFGSLVILALKNH